MTEQIKREAGASRKTERRQRIDITLPPSVIDYLDTQSASRSRFIENCIWEHKQKWEELVKANNVRV